MPCYKRRARGSVRIASMGNARATPALHCREEAFRPTTHAFICIYAFESASVIRSQTVREQRDCEDRRAHQILSFSLLCVPSPRRGPEVSRAMDHSFFFPVSG